MTLTFEGDLRSCVSEAISTRVGMKIGGRHTSHVGSDFIRIIFISATLRQVRHYRRPGGQGQQHLTGAPGLTCLIINPTEAKNATGIKIWKNNESLFQLDLSKIFESGFYLRTNWAEQFSSPSSSSKLSSMDRSKVSKTLLLLCRVLFFPRRLSAAGGIYGWRDSAWLRAWADAIACGAVERWKRLGS